jgi:carbamoyl-phosphate synthase large subunit
MPGESGEDASLEAFGRRVGYPLIAKPVRGTGSRGVFYVRDPRDAQVMAQRDGYLFQEYLGDSRGLEPYFATLQGPPPLFAHSQNAGYRVCYTVISPSGDISPILVTDQETEGGHTILVKRILDPALEALTVDYARALLTEGGAGPLGVQLRKDRRGNWKAQEINLRTNAGTLARFLLGMDELYFIVKAFVPEVSFPELRPNETDRCDTVRKRYHSYPVFDSKVSTLRDSGIWSRS